VVAAVRNAARAGYGTAHSEELPYVFHQLREHDRPARTPKDEAMTDLMRTYWTNFAKTGDPNGAGLPNLAGLQQCQTADVVHRVRQYEGGSGCE
jgi:carboxylesterase type B